LKSLDVNDILDQMKKPVGILMLLLGMVAGAMASVAPVPEIDPTTGIGALALLSGALLVLRARRKS
jgi:MYXO-CTERM domain-containing protein